MEYILTAEEMRKCDHYTIEHFGVPAVVLMERAALKCVNAIIQEGYSLDRVLVVCGSGNNGGDGFAIARIFHERGVKVDVLLAGSLSQMSAETRGNYESCVKYGIPIRSAVKDDEYTLIVDAVFGIGINRVLERPTAEFIEGINSFRNNGARIVSVDIPSGVNASSGEIMGAAIRADMTVTFGYYKKGLMLYPGAEYAGKLMLVNIGITDESLKELTPSLKCLTKSDIINAPQFKRPDHSHKGTFGKVLIVAGSENMGGCALLAALSCFRAGAGMVRVLTHENNRKLINDKLPEALVDTYTDSIDTVKLAEVVKWADVTAIGPGIGKDELAKKLFEFTFFKSSGSFVIDADALGMLKHYRMTLKKDPGRNIIITPHIGEFVKFTGMDKEVVMKDLVGLTKRVAQTFNLTCVTKDSRSVISSKEGECCINLTGNNGMATAGMGDCLFGIIAAFLAKGMSPYDAAVYGCYVHGYAGDLAARKRGKTGLIATDLIEALKECMGESDE